MAILQKSQMTLEEDEASLLNGELAKVVYKRAIEAIPGTHISHRHVCCAALDKEHHERILLCMHSA